MFIASSPEELPDRDTLLSLTGLDFMLKMKAGEISRPPIAGIMDYHLEEVEDGRVVFRGTPSFPHLNPMGGVHGGWYGTLLDSCMACAVMTKVPRGSVYTTLEYKVNLVGALPPGRTILATGTIDHAGRSTGVASGTITDAETGRLYATCSTTCLIMRVAP